MDNNYSKQQRDMGTSDRQLESLKNLKRQCHVMNISSSRSHALSKHQRLSTETQAFRMKITEARVSQLSRLL